MKTLNSRFIKIWLFSILLVPFTTGCGGGQIIDPMPTDIDYYYSDPEAQERNLWIKGAARSGIVAVLDDHSPFIIFSMSDDVFRAYLAEQGVSESEFLASPDLRAFYETHVIDDAPDLYEVITVEGAMINAETLSGKIVTIEHRSDGFDNGRGTLFVEGREMAEAPLNEDNTNYDWTLLHRPIIDFPLK